MLSGHIPYTYDIVVRTHLALSSFNHFDEITIFNVYFYYYCYAALSLAAAATSEKIKLVKEIFFSLLDNAGVCARRNMQTCRYTFDSHIQAFLSAAPSPRLV